MSASRTDPSARLAAAAMASWAVSLHGGPRPTTARTTSSSSRKSSRKRRQRERIVAKTWPGRCDTMRISDRCGGSSIILSNALAPFGLRSSAASTIAIRQPPKAADNWNTCSPLRTSSTAISVASRFGLVFHSRRIREKSGWASPASSRAAEWLGSTWRLCASRTAFAAGSGFASTKRANAHASVALPIPSLPPISQAWARRPSR